MVITFRLCVLRTNSDFCLIQSQQFGFYNRGGGCLQRGRDKSLYNTYGFLKQNLAYASALLLTCHTHQRFHSSWLDHRNNIWLGAQITQLLTVKFPPGTNTFISTLFSNIPTLCSSLNVNNQVSHPCKNRPNYNPVGYIPLAIFAFPNIKHKDKN
jgi:hypothetical protein